MILLVKPAAVTPMMARSWSPPSASLPTLPKLSVGTMFRSLVSWGRALTHLYVASEGDVDTLQQADIIFYNGLFLEAQMAEVFEQLSTRKTVTAVAERIDRQICSTGRPVKTNRPPCLVRCDFVDAGC